MEIDQLELVGLGKVEQGLARQSLQALAVDRLEPGQRHLLAGYQCELGLHRFEEVELFQLAAEGSRANELSPIFLQELQHVVDIGGWLGVFGEQRLAVAAVVEAGKRLVHAKREGLAVFACRKDEGVAPYEGRHVLALPVVVGIQEKIFLVACTEHHDRHDLIAVGREDDRVFRRGRRELDGHQRDRVDPGGEGVIGAGFDRALGMAAAGHGNRGFIDEQLGGHEDGLVVMVAESIRVNSPWMSAGCRDRREA